MESVPPCYLACICTCRVISPASFQTSVSRGPAVTLLLECAGALPAGVLGKAALGKCLRAGIPGSHSGRRDAGGEAGNVRSRPGDLPMARTWCQRHYPPLLPAQLSCRGDMATPSCALCCCPAPFRGHSAHITMKGNRFKGTETINVCFSRVWRLED